MTALVRLGGILFMVASVRAVAALAVGPPPDLPDEPNRASLLRQQTDSAMAQAERRRRPLEEGERIPINRASEEELDRLPRVGPSLAQAILAEREQGGGFPGPAALTRVRGVGPATAERLAPLLDFRGAGPGRQRLGSRADQRLSLASATLQELQALPGIGPALAARILAARAKREVRSVEDLIRVPGIGPAKLAQLRERVMP